MCFKFHLELDNAIRRHKIGQHAKETANNYVQATLKQCLEECIGLQAYNYVANLSNRRQVLPHFLLFSLSLSLYRSLLRSGFIPIISTLLCIFNPSRI